MSENKAADDNGPKLLEPGDMFGDMEEARAGRIRLNEIAPNQSKYAILCANTSKGNGHE